MIGVLSETAAAIGFVLLAFQASAEEGGPTAASVAGAKVRMETCLDVATRTLGGQATHLEFESRNGTPTYEFILRSGEVEYYVGCDATTGLLGRIDIIVQESDPRWTSVAKVDEAAARRIATERYGGEVEDVKRLLMGDGRAAYEVDLEFGSSTGELNVYVDAVTGTIFMVNPEYWEIGGGRESRGSNQTRRVYGWPRGDQNGAGTQPRSRRAGSAGAGTGDRSARAG